MYRLSRIVERQSSNIIYTINKWSRYAQIKNVKDYVKIGKHSWGLGNESFLEYL